MPIQEFGLSEGKDRRHLLLLKRPFTVCKSNYLLHTISTAFWQQDSLCTSKFSNKYFKRAEINPLFAKYLLRNLGNTIFLQNQKQLYERTQCCLTSATFRQQLGHVNQCTIYFTYQKHSKVGSLSHTLVYPAPTIFTIMWPRYRLSQK